MALRPAITSGDLSGATTFGSLSNTPTIHASTNITLGASAIYSATFTAPAASGVQCLGAYVYLVAPSYGAAKTITCTLQDNSVDTTATATYTLATDSNTTRDNNQWIYFKFGTPYTYTATTAGLYRFKITRNSAPTASSTIAADSGGSNFAYMAIDDRTGAIATTDQVYIISDNVNEINVRAIGTQTIGNNSATLASGLRSVLNDCVMSAKGVLYFATANTTSNLTVKGWVHTHSRGKLEIGTPEQPIDSAITATITFSMATAGDVGVYNHYYGDVYMQGATKQYWRSTIWSGAVGMGTTANPLITNDNTYWSVGEELIIVPASNSATNYLESETRFIVSALSQSSYVLSSTLGGAEAGLTYSHFDNAEILNITRNVVITTNNVARGAWLSNYCVVDTTNISMQWMRWNYPGSTASNRSACYGELATTNGPITFNYNVFSNNLGTNGLYLASFKENTLTGNIFCNSSAASCESINLNVPQGHTFNDTYVVNCRSGRVTFNYALNTTFNRLKCYGAMNADGNVLLHINGHNAQFNDCECHCSRLLLGSIYYTSRDIRFKNFIEGTMGTNKNAVIYTTTKSNMVFENCIFSSTSIPFLITGNTANSINISFYQSIAAFQKFNGQENNDFWYEQSGYAHKCGVGLVDDTRKSGDFCLRMTPSNYSTGYNAQTAFIWSFEVLARKNTTVNVWGYIKKQQSFSGNNVVVQIDFPFNGASSSLYTMPNDENWNRFYLSGYYTGETSFATVTISGTGLNNGSFYVDDIYSGKNKLVSFDAWIDGKPSTLMFTDYNYDSDVLLTTDGDVMLRLDNNLLQKID